jgi:acyl-CoA synthetase (AMP-forming)/AMP-acid ligase II
MTVQPVAGPRPDAGRQGAISLLDLLDDAATGRGTVHFIADEPEPARFSELWDASEHAARWIAAKVGTGGVVAVVLTNTRPCVTALLGAWRAGCTVASLPLPARGMLAQVYAGQITRFCAAAGAQTLLVDPDHAPLLADTPLLVHTFDETLSGGPPTSFVGEGALVQFTSGSVGTPKGIHLTLDAVGANVLAIVAALEPVAGDGLCSWLPLSHDMGLIGQLLSPLAAGAPQFGHVRLTLMKPDTFMANPRSWLRTCSATGATITVGPNFALELAVRTSRRIGSLDLSRVRAIIVGSESVRADTLERFSDAFAPAGFRPLSLCPGYGLAEATVAVTIVRPHEPWRSIPRPADHAAPAPGGASRSLVSTGSPIDGVDVRVTAPDGRVGPIELRSPSLLSRYIGADLCLTDDGYFVTGDIGVMHDGELFVIGRGDEAIVVAGRNLYPDDIESAVHHESIRRGCIAAVAAPDGGLAIVVEPSASSMSRTELETACRGIRTVVASQTGCPLATVAFVPRGSLPKTPSGKLRRLAISRSLAADDGLLARVNFG